MEKLKVKNTFVWYRTFFPKKFNFKDELFQAVLDDIDLPYLSRNPFKKLLQLSKDLFLN